jgi:predicted DsbA family dithiol-disulfide isomerase
MCEDEAMTSIVLDVWADILCPWCYIGKRRLEQAIAASERPAEVTVFYHAYQLNPDAPVGSGRPVAERLAEKYGTDRAGGEAMAQRAAEAARPDGLNIVPELQLEANSFDGHRLVALGLAQGGPALQAAVLERLFSAHFAEGRQVDDREVLQRLGAEAGLDERRLGAVLASDEFADQVRADEAAAAEMGIRGVPFTIANQRVAVAGAQPAEVFGLLLKRAAEPQSHEERSAAREGGSAPAP